METIIRRLDEKKWTQFRALCLKKDISANKAVKKLIYTTVDGIDSLNVNIPADLLPQLNEAAKKEGRSRSNLVSWLLQRAVKELVWRSK